MLEVQEFVKKKSLWDTPFIVSCFLLWVTAVLKVPAFTLRKGRDMHLKENFGGLIFILLFNELEPLHCIIWKIVYFIYCINLTIPLQSAASHQRFTPHYFFFFPFLFFTLLILFTIIQYEMGILIVHIAIDFSNFWDNQHPLFFMVWLASQLQHIIILLCLLIIDNILH